MATGLLPGDAELLRRVKGGPGKFPESSGFVPAWRPGDVVRVLNTGAPAVEPLEGFGDWNIAWASYAKR